MQAGLFRRVGVVGLPRTEKRKRHTHTHKALFIHWGLDLLWQFILNFIVLKPTGS